MLGVLAPLTRPALRTGRRYRVHDLALLCLRPSRASCFSLLRHNTNSLHILDVISFLLADDAVVDRPARRHEITTKHRSADAATDQTIEKVIVRPVGSRLPLVDLATSTSRSDAVLRADLVAHHLEPLTVDFKKCQSARVALSRLES